jgi:putative phosphoesterase
LSLSNTGNIAVFDNIDLQSDHIRVGLISDTHIPRDAKTMPPRVQEVFKYVDLILHAGDIYVPEVLDELETIAPVIAARGNGDWDFPQDHRLGTHCIIKIAGLTLGLSHALHYSEGLKATSQKMIEKQFGQALDIVVIGDTHVAVIERHKGVLLINPGSPTVPIASKGIGTVGILEIGEKKATARIVRLS